MTLYLVATKHSQGTRDNDFCHADDGELLHFCSECDGERIDGKCGCKRAMVGMQSSKATTTMLIKDVPHSEEELRIKLFETLKREGWVDVTTNDDQEWEEMIREEVKEVMGLCEFFGENTVLEKRGDEFVARGYVEKPKIENEIERALYEMRDRGLVEFDGSLDDNPLIKLGKEVKEEKDDQHDNNGA